MRLGVSLSFAVSIAASVAVLPLTAHAERQTILSFSGGIAAVGPLDPPDEEIGGPEDAALQLRTIVSFEEPPIPYKEPKGYAFDGTIVPEIFAGLLSSGEDRTAMVGGGARFELTFSQRRMGLLEVSARGGMYLAARGGLFTDRDHTPFLEGAFGEYFLVGDTARIGFEMGIMSIRTMTTKDAPTPIVPVDGAVFGPPFDQGRGSYLNVNASLFLGVAL